MLRPLSVACLAGLLIAGCTRRNAAECDILPVGWMLRLRLVDAGGADLLKGGQRGIRFRQACKTTELQPVYDSLALSGADSAWIVWFDDLATPLTDNDPNGCYRILVDYPSGDRDTLQWKFVNGPGGCSYSIDDVRYNGVMAPKMDPDFYLATKH